MVEFVMTESRASLGIDLGIRGLKVSHLSNVQYCTVPTLVCLFINNIFSVRIICGPLSWRDDRLTGHGTSEKAYSYSTTRTRTQPARYSMVLYVCTVHQSSVRHDI